LHTLLNTMTFHGDLLYTTKQFTTNLTDVTLTTWLLWSNFKHPYWKTLYISIVFHNLSGYYTHFIIKEIVIAYNGHVNVLPITKEKYISFTKHVKDTAERADSRKYIKLRFIDSFKFLSTNFDKLASFLSKDKLKIICPNFQHSDEEFELLTHKVRVFPYEYVGCVEKL